MLFEPLEEQLYLPSILVEVGNLLGSQFHGVGQEHELTALLLIIEPNEPQMLKMSAACRSFPISVLQIYKDTTQFRFGTQSAYAV